MGVGLGTSQRFPPVSQVLHAFESVLLPINQKTYGATIFVSRSISSRPAEMQLGLSNKHRALVKILLEEIPCSWVLREWNYRADFTLRLGCVTLVHL